jgi:hypothetical protein
VRVLFSMRHLGSVRMYETVLRRLAEAGHDVHVVANRRDSLGDGGIPDALLPDVPGIQWSWDDVRPNRWLELATAIRIWLDYLRYFEPAYLNAPRLRERAAERVPALRCAASRGGEWFAPRPVVASLPHASGSPSALCRARRRSMR